MFISFRVGYSQIILMLVMIQSGKFLSIGKKKEFCLTTLCLDPVTIDFLSRSKCTSFHVLRNNMYYLFMQLVGNLVLGDHCVLVIVGKKKLFLRWFYVSFPFFNYLYSVINILVKTATKLTFKLL